MYRIVAIPIAFTLTLLFLLTNHKSKSHPPKTHGDERIVNGISATNCHGYVDLLFNDEQICGGVIYLNKWNQPGIITADHCRQLGRMPQTARIYPNNCSPTESIICQITGWLTHKDISDGKNAYYLGYDETADRRMADDIAVAGFTNCNLLEPDFRTLNIPHLPNPHDAKIAAIISNIKGKEATLIGRGMSFFIERWGTATTAGSPYYPVKAAFRVVRVKDGIIRVESDTSSVCYGDSGSGLYYKAGNESILIGIAESIDSHSGSCAPRKIANYVNLMDHYDRIINIKFPKVKVDSINITRILPCLFILSSLYILIRMYQTIAARPYDSYGAII